MQHILQRVQSRENAVVMKGQVMKGLPDSVLYPAKACVRIYVPEHGAEISAA